MTVEARTIVVDVDDTISTHVNRDYANAVPHRDIIDKLNRLYFSGWRIVYFTARGMVSCDGDLELIEKKNRAVLESWLERNGVKYHELRFGKPIGVYYIDDKAITPQEFMKTEIETLRGGSGSTVHRMGDRVVKKAANAAEQAAWYATVSKVLPNNVPKVHTYYADTIDMSFIEGSSLNDVIDGHRLSALTKLLKVIEKAAPAEATWDTMVSRVREHHAACGGYACHNELMRVIDSRRVHDEMNARRGFSHGDMTFENCIVNGRLFLIDPNNPSGLYSSIVMDYGKILQSLHGYEEIVAGAPPRAIKARILEEQVPALMGEDFRLAKLALAVHYVRMLKYKSGATRRYFEERIYTMLTEFMKSS